MDTQTYIRTAETFILTGIDTEGRRFRKESKNCYYLSCHNVWRGNLWAVINGKRYRIKHWFN
jgi:hypothetical protein